MANTASAKKEARASVSRTLRNRSVRSTQSAEEPESCFLTSAGVPAARWPAGTSRPSGSTDPAASIAPAPSRVPCSITEPMPTTAPSSTVQASMQARWPTVTLAPIRVGLSREQWITALSWMLVPGPIVIEDSSPRRTAPNQIVDPAPTSTSPTRTAVGATQASGCTRGRLASNSNSGIAYNPKSVFDKPKRTLTHG